MKTIHLACGGLFFAVFLATGTYMWLMFSSGDPPEPIVRMMFRSAHVYILLAGLLNVAFATNDGVAPSKVLRCLAMVGSLCLLASPAVFTWAFFAEPAPDRLGRPVSLAGVILAIVGTVLRYIASPKQD